MKKTKRYDEGDEVKTKPIPEDESERGSMTAEQQANSDATNAAATNAAAKTAEPQSFKEAFAKGRAEALAGGSGTFTWNGKSYGTDLASSKPAAKTVISKAEAPAPKAETKATPKAEAPAPKAETKATPKAETKKTSTNPDVPTSEEAAANRKAAAEKIGRVASGIGSYLKETFTPSGRMEVEQRRKANKATSDNYKSRAPGAKKGGMTSFRGDGIAQRGRTKGTFR
jgi:hypothetical protein